MTAHNLLQPEQSRQETAKQRILHQLFHVSRPVTVLSVALLAATAVLGSTINTISYLNSISTSLPIAAGHRTIQHSSHTQNLALLGSAVSGQVLGDSITAPQNTTDVNSTIAGLVNSQLKQFLSQGLLTGPQGPAGSSGVVQNGNGLTTTVISGNPVVTYVPSQQSNGFVGGSLAGFGQLSASSLESTNATINGNLNVNDLQLQQALPISSGGTGTSTLTGLQNALNLSYLSSSSQSSFYNYVAWGDSLTSGNEDGTGVAYPGVLQSLLAQNVINEGVGGQTSSQIGVRQGGVATNVTVSGGTIPASGGVTVTFTTGYEPVNSQGPSGGTSGTIDGVHGTVTLSGSTYTFTRTSTGSAVSLSGAAPFVVDQPYQGFFNIIWAGRNDGGATTTVESNIASMIADLPNPKQFLIMSILNGEGEGIGTQTYANITAENAYLAATYPTNYLDIREYLVGLYNPSNGADVIDYQNDIPPSSLRAVDGYGTITQNISATTTSFTVSPAAYAPEILKVGSEEIFVSSVSGNTITSAIRGYGSTTASSYSSGQPFTGIDPLHLGANGYTDVANKIAGWLSANNSGIGSHPLNITNLPSVFASPPAIGSITPSYGTFSQLAVGSYFASSTPTGGLVVSGKTGIGTSNPLATLTVDSPYTPASLTGTTTMQLMVRSETYGDTGIDFGGLNSSNPEGRIAMTTGSNGSYLNFGTTDSWSAGIDHIGMTIDYAGRVGIGTTTPTQPLSVSGNMILSGALFDGTSASGTAGMLLETTGTGTKWVSTSTLAISGGAGQWTTAGSNIYYSGGNVGIGTTSPITPFAIQGTAGSDVFDVASSTGAPDLYVAQAGFVGVGTNNPLSALHVYTRNSISSFTGTTHLGLTVDGSGQTGIDFADGGGVGNTVPKARIAMSDNSIGSYLELGTTDNWSGGIDHIGMTINPNGYVGIGTSGPLSTLTVDSPYAGASLTGTSTMQLMIRSETYGDSGIDFGSANSNTNPLARIAMTTGSNGSYLNFGTTDSWSAGIDHIGMTIDYAGRVGVGTTTPGYNLTVAGTSLNTATSTFLGNVGIGTTSPSYLLYVGSSSVASGTVAQFQNANGTCAINPTLNTLACSSDERLKKDIIPYGNDALDQVMALQPVFFNWNAEASGTPEHPGFIAQQVQQVMPEVVSTDPNTGLLSIGYSDLVPAVVNAMQQMQAEITTIQGGLNGNASTSNLTVYSPSNFSGDSVGQAEVAASETSVRISFSQPYAFQPIVTLTPTADYSGHYWVGETDADGFTVDIDQSSLLPLVFNWHSFSSPAEQLTVSGGSTSQIVLIVPAAPPAAEVQSAGISPDNNGSASLTPDPSASSTPTSVSASSTPAELGTATSTPAVDPTPSPATSPPPSSGPTPIPAPTVTPADSGTPTDQGSGSGS